MNEETISGITILSFSFMVFFLKKVYTILITN